MLRRLSGVVMEVSPEFEKAPLPISVSPSGKRTDVRRMQSRKALSQMRVTPGPKLRSVM